MKAGRAGALGLAVLAFAAAAFAQTPTPAPALASSSAGSAAAASPVPRLTSRQKAERIRDLPEEERRWLTDYVAPIILPDEENLFLQLTAGYQRQMFKAEFWQRRERSGLPPPLGPGYEARYGHLREIAAQEYDGVNSDAGRMVVRLGEPASIADLSDCSEVYRQADIWSYPNASSSREIRHLFYRPSFGAPRRLWIPGDRGIFQTASCLSSFDQACAITASGAPPRASVEFCRGPAVPRSCAAACAVATLASQIQLRGLQEGSVIAQAPAVSTEGLEGLWTRLASVSNPAARPIAVESAATLLQPASTQEPPREPGWSNEEIRERIVALPRKYREWLDLAGPLLSAPELVAFLRLPAGERDGYIRRFWRRHGHVK